LCIGAQIVIELLDARNTSTRMAVFVKTSQDLVIAIRRMHQQYAAGRMDRDILRGWVLGLPSYPAPHGRAIEALKERFSIRVSEVTPELRDEDLLALAAVTSADDHPA
jgi:hypothetical protein